MATIDVLLSDKLLRALSFTSRTRDTPFDTANTRSEVVIVYKLRLMPHCNSLKEK